MEVQFVDSDQLRRYTGYVEGNCEYLTYIRNTVTPKSKKDRDALRTLDVYMQESSTSENKSKLYFEGLVQLIIQLGYFLYSCKNVAKRPDIELEDIRVEENYVKAGEKRFSILIFYGLPGEVMEEMYGYQIFKCIMDHIEQAIHSYMQNRKENQENSNAGDGQFEAAYQLFWKQFQQLAQNQQLAQDQGKFFQCLQQTSLFYEYSMLYRIKNCSLLDYIRTNPTHMDIFQDFKSKEENLINHYNQEKKRSKENAQALKAKQKEIDRNLQNFFEKISQKNVQIVSKNEKEPTNRVRFIFRQKQKQKTPFQQILANLQGENAMSEQVKKDFRRPLGELEYFVQYSSERNSICVRLYLPSIVVNVQTSDFLMFQSNVLTFDAANVSIELCQPKLKLQEKVPKKVVTFKGTSSFNIKEPPLQKILLLMDITMIASRIYEPEMNSQKYVQGGKQSYLKLNSVSKKVSHYTKLFMKCAKQVYDN